MFVVFLVVVCGVVVVFLVVVCGVVVVVVVVNDDEGVRVVVLVVVLLVVIRAVVDAVFVVSDSGEPYLQTGCGLLYLFQTFGTYSSFPFAWAKKNSWNVRTNEIVHFSWLLRFFILFQNHRSGTVNSNTVYSKFHLIRSFFEIFARFLLFHV